MHLVALRSREFRLLLRGQAVSLTGSQMQQVAVVWQLYLLTRSPLALGMLGFFRIAPIAVFALGGGVLADALDRRRLMLVTQTLLALVSVAFAILSHTQRTTPAAIYALSFVAGAATAFDNPARQALVPRLVDSEQLPNALSLYVTTFQIAMVAGPSIGGALLATSGPTAIYVLDVLSYAAVIGGLAAATIATLFVLPAVFAVVMHRADSGSPSLDPFDDSSRYAVSSCPARARLKLSTHWSRIPRMKSSVATKNLSTSTR